MNFFNNLKLALPLVLITTLASSMSLLSLPAPHAENNACAIFKEYPQWYSDAQQAQKKWGVPISTQLAIIQQESHFDADTRPLRSTRHNTTSSPYASSATGYSQALHKTWNHYLADNNKFYGDPRNFADSVDFIGWYVNQVRHALGISANNTRAIYIAYHEGVDGYKSKTYLNKHPWLESVAHKVQRQANLYQSQLNRCVL